MRKGDVLLTIIIKKWAWIGYNTVWEELITVGQPKHYSGNPKILRGTNVGRERGGAGNKTLSERSGMKYTNIRQRCRERWEKKNLVPSSGLIMADDDDDVPYVVWWWVR